MCRHRELSSRGVCRQEGNPTIIKGRDTRATQSLLGTAALSAPSLLPCTVVSRCPQMQLSDHLRAGLISQQSYSSSQLSCKATAPAPLLAQGTQSRVLQAPWGAGLALETGLESSHPTGKVVMDGCWGYNRGKQAGAQPGEIPSFKGMIQREAIHGAPAPVATGEST